MEVTEGKLKKNKGNDCGAGGDSFYRLQLKQGKRGRAVALSGLSIRIQCSEGED